MDKLKIKKAYKLQESCSESKTTRLHVVHNLHLNHDCIMKTKYKLNTFRRIVIAKESPKFKDQKFTYYNLLYNSICFLDVKVKV